MAGSRRRADFAVGSHRPPPQERRKCSCDDDPPELGEQRVHCPLHDGPTYDDLDPWGDPR